MIAGMNFVALLRDQDGCVVPGSIREGHNVFTTYGKERFARLFAWSSIGAVDVPVSDSRLFATVVGNGSHAETPDVVALQGGLQVSSGVYWKACNTPHVFPSTTSVTLVTTYLASEITFGGTTAVTISEAGMTGGVGNTPESSLWFYKTFTPLVKLSSFSLDITWELKF